MDVTASSQVDAMAVEAGNAQQVAVLKTAIDGQQSLATQLLAALPQAENKGTLVDVQV